MVASVHLIDNSALSETRSPKVAIVHDWLTFPGGAERVLEQMLIAYPEADLYTVCDFLEEEHRHLLVGRTPKTTFIQKLPMAKKRHWLFLPLMPIAIEQFDLSGYDIVLSSSYCVAKGVLTGPDQTHVSYIHTPIRYAWNLQHQYLQEMNLTEGFRSIVVRALLHYLRIWDIRSSHGVDAFVANSKYVARQVKRLYKQECEVLHPPADLDRFTLEETKDDYYVTASRLVPYKRVDLIVRAFARMPGRKLIVIGDGVDRHRIRQAAQGCDNIEVLGYRSFESLRHLVSKAKAFVFAAVEDFGIATVEAQACGTPVIALGKGGSLETVVPLGCDNPTGVFFFDQTADAIVEAVMKFELESRRMTPGNCRLNAERFSQEKFRDGLLESVRNTVAAQS